MIFEETGGTVKNPHQLTHVIIKRKVRLDSLSIKTR